MKHCYNLTEKNRITEMQLFINNNDLLEAPKRAVANIINFSKSYKSLRYGNNHIGIIAN